MWNRSIVFLHGGNWQMFMNYQKFPGSLGHNFVGKWFIAKKIMQDDSLICLWGCKFEGKGFP